MENENHLKEFIDKVVKILILEPGDSRVKALPVTIKSIANNLVVFRSQMGMGCVRIDYIVAIKPMIGVDRMGNGKKVS